MAILPTNFKDDILDTSVNTRRKYRMYENADGTVEFEDVTEYSQVGSEFGAGQINDINEEVNQKFDKNMVVRDLNTIGAMTKEGYVPDALALKEVNQSLEELGSFESGSKYNIIKIGKQRIIHIYGYNNASITTNLFILDENNRPKSDISGIANIMDNNGAVTGTIITIATNGNVTTLASIANKYVNAVLVYQVN